MILTWAVVSPAADEADSLHVRMPDSTRIVTDRETVPAAIRSRGHQLSLANPLGFIPREESGATGYWNASLSPQYDRTVSVRGIELRSRIRPAVPLRYLPQHSLIGVRFNIPDSLRYPLRMHSLKRPLEPMVDITYKKGDYALNSLSVNMAFDILDDTHIHLAREGNSYVGQYGIEGIQNERYHLAVHHRVSDSTTFLYQTLYTRDQISWTAATPVPRRLGNEKARWYHHLLQWKTTLQPVELGYGARLGSNRLNFPGDGFRRHWTEFQRGLWLDAGFQIMDTLPVRVGYEIEQFHVRQSRENPTNRYWHTVSLSGTYRQNSILLENTLQIRNISGDAGGRFLLDQFRGSYSPLSWWEIFVDYQRDLAVPPAQWSTSQRYVRSPETIGEATIFTTAGAGMGIRDLLNTHLTAQVQNIQYSDWYRLSYQHQIDRTDSLVTVESSSGQLRLLNVSLRTEPFSWLAFGGQGQWIPEYEQKLPEIWSALSAAGYLHFSHYLFNRNMLLHLYAEGGFYSDRLPVGWNPMLQSLTYYQERISPGTLFFTHLYAAGEVGPFTVSVSFYNALGANLQYVIDQRVQVPAFYLGVEWQFWN